MPDEQPFLAARRFEGRVALITGGTSGIGKATALAFAREGATVAITGRRPGRGQAAVEEIEATGAPVCYVEADHTRLEDCHCVVEQTMARCGHIDVLFNNAGVVTFGSAETTSEETWAVTLALNVTAVWRMCKLVLPHMRAQGGGVIVNNASDWGLVGARNALPYATSKGAVVQMTRSMALDHARENIRVNAVCPGDTFVDRWVQEGFLKGLDEVERQAAIDDMAEALPVGRLGRPEEIARAVLFLASDEASFITGVAMPVDGGNTAQ